MAELKVSITGLREIQENFPEQKQKGRETRLEKKR